MPIQQSAYSTAPVGPIIKKDESIQDDAELIDQMPTDRKTPLEDDCAVHENTEKKTAKTQIVKVIKPDTYLNNLQK